MILSTCRSQPSFLAAQRFPIGQIRQIGRIGQVGRTNIAVGFALILAATLLSGCATRRQNQISIAPSPGRSAGALFGATTAGAERVGGRIAGGV